MSVAASCAVQRWRSITRAAITIVGTVQRAAVSLKKQANKQKQQQQQKDMGFEYFIY